MKVLRFGLVMAVSVVALAACGGDDDSDNDVAPTVTPVVQEAPPGNAGRGETLFVEQGCISCHAVDSDAVLSGPALTGVAREAADRVAGLDAAAYLRQSLVEPDAYIVEGFQPGVMQSYANLPETDITDLVAYLLTLDE